MATGHGRKTTIDEQCQSDDQVSPLPTAAVPSGSGFTRRTSSPDPQDRGDLRQDGFHPDAAYRHTTTHATPCPELPRMTVANSLTQPSPFRHEALLYASQDQYLQATTSFIQDGLDHGEDVFVAVPSSNLRRLRSAFTDNSASLTFVPMEVVGRNPARIIPALLAMARESANAGRGFRLVGEPIWPERTYDEIFECARHEVLANLAFEDVMNVKALCPYDVSTLDESIINDAYRSHPNINLAGQATANGRYEPRIAPSMNTPLSPIPPHAEKRSFTLDDLHSIRRWVTNAALEAGVPSGTSDDLAVAVCEATTNSVVHGGGSGHIALWQEGSRIVCDIRDQGTIDDPLAGRRRPPIDGAGGRGLWLMQQFCDLVQIRALPDGQAVRLQLQPPGADHNE